MANGKIRGDFVSTLPDGKGVESHMISDGTTNYMWSSAMPGQGMKMAMTAEGAPGSPGGMQNEAIDWNQNYNYDCDSWNADDSKFELPSDVKFTDMNQMMQDAIPAGISNGGSAGGSAGVEVPAQCAVCEELAGDQKAQCLAAMGC